MSSTARAESYAWLEHRLDQWAQWKRGGILAALGYGSLLGRYTKTDVRSGPAVQHDNPAFDRMMLELDRAIADLPEFLARIVRMTHDHASPDDALPPAVMAAELEVSVSTLYYRRKLAYRQLAERVKQ